MATIKLTPSTYYLSNSSYLSVQNASNMYADCDSENYATITNSQTGTTSYYIYLRGFNFDAIPSNAVINSFTVRFKARESGVSTSTSYRPYLCNGTTTITGTASMPSTTAQTITFTGVSATWETIKGYGDNFGIRINCRRASRNTTGYMYIYGAEIEVDYTVPNPRTITSTLEGDGTISPSGAITTYDGEEYELTITPTDPSDEITVTKDGVDITDQLVAHGTEQSADRVLGTYTLKSGGFNGQGASYFQGLVGKGVDNTKTTSNYYSSGSNTQAVFTYDMSFNLPSNANITRVWCEVNGHAESTSQSSEYMVVQLKSGNTALSEAINFKSVSTSNTTITLEAETLPTVEQLASMVLECTLGYYGGAINGATCYVEYDTGGSIDHYTYTYIVSGDATIAVVIGSQAQPHLFFKENGSWTEAVKAYKKVNGSWVEQDITTVFQSGVNYKKGN